MKIVHRWYKRITRISVALFNIVCVRYYQLIQILPINDRIGFSMFVLEDPAQAPLRSNHSAEKTKLNLTAWFQSVEWWLYSSKEPFDTLQDSPVSVPDWNLAGSHRRLLVSPEFPATGRTRGEWSMDCWSGDRIEDRAKLRETISKIVSDLEKIDDLWSLIVRNGIT